MDGQRRGLSRAAEEAEDQGVDKDRAMGLCGAAPHSHRRASTSSVQELLVSSEPHVDGAQLASYRSLPVFTSTSFTTQPVTGVSSSAGSSDQ